MSLPLISRPGRALLAVLLVAVAVTAAWLAVRPASQAGADNNPNNIDCRGHLEKGPVNDDPELSTVKYEFACSQPITGFQVQPQLAVQAYETENFGTDRTTGQPTSDAFSCNGEIPGFGVNCVMAAAGKPYSGKYNIIAGTFDIEGDICAEPRVDAILSVTFASLNDKGAITQFLAGPFGLGRPQGCKPGKNAGKVRIPRPEPAEDAEAE